MYERLRACGFTEQMVADVLKLYEDDALEAYVRLIELIWNV